MTDPLFDAAYVLLRQKSEAGKILCHRLLREKLEIGHTRAARIVIQLERAGLVSDSDEEGQRTINHFR